MLLSWSKYSIGGCSAPYCLAPCVQTGERTLEVLCSIPKDGASREPAHPRPTNVSYTHSHLQSCQGRETLEQPRGQGREGVVEQAPVGVEGTHDERRREDTSATDKFFLQYMAINTALLAPNKDGDGVRMY